MNKRDLKLREKRLRKEVLSAVGKRIPLSQTDMFPWQLLEKLVQDFDDLPLNLKEDVTSVLNSRSALDYMALQKYGDVQLYSSPAEFFSATSVISFLKKYPFGKVAGLDPLASAEKRFADAEKLCRITNRRLRWYREKGYRLQKHRPNLHSILHTARLYIARWLGPLDLNKIYDYTRHGPGGSVGVSGNQTTTYYKYASEPYTVTTRAYPYAEAAILADPLWRRYIVNPSASLGDPVPTPSEGREALKLRLKVTDHNKVTFVPKTAQTHRAIAIEPTLNIFLQLGVGDYMKDCLRHVGIDLRSQERNQSLAREGSNFRGPADLCPATIDMSMASDTVSIELVRELLPEEWFNFLDDLRSHYGVYDQREILWSKFSSMGNGFTFQLESMIFASLAFSVARHLRFSRKFISIYGDDIIVPRGMALQLIETLAYTGFRVNTEKSFFHGPFRESCGADWFEGRNVRPFFLKRRIQNAKDLVFLHNSQASKIAETLAILGRTCHRRYSNFKRFCLVRLPGVIVENLLGPVVQDLEGHLHSSWDEAQKSSFVSWNRDWQTWSYASVKALPKRYHGKVGPLYLQLMDHRVGNSPDIDKLVDDSLAVVEPKPSLLKAYAHLLALEMGQRELDTPQKSILTRRKSTKLCLMTQASTGWRNN